MNLNLTLILQIISFLILMGLLAKFLYKPLIKMLEERSSQIAQDIESARRSEEEAKRYAEETQKALNIAKEEAIRIKEQSRKDTDSTRREMLGETKKESISMIDRAKKEIEKEVTSARLRLRGEISNLSTEVAKKILKREIDKKDHEKLIDESIKEIGNGPS